MTSRRNEKEERKRMADAKAREQNKPKANLGGVIEGINQMSGLIHVQMCRACQHFNYCPSSVVCGHEQRLNKEKNISIDEKTISGDKSAPISSEYLNSEGKVITNQELLQIFENPELIQKAMIMIQKEAEEGAKRQKENMDKIKQKFLADRELALAEQKANAVVEDIKQKAVDPELELLREKKIQELMNNPETETETEDNPETEE